MPTLILLLPPRERLRAQGQATPASPGESPARKEAGGEYDYVYSNNGQQVTAEGRATLSALPRADQIVLMPADADLAWHRVKLPKVARARLPGALAGLMEDELLDDAEALHFALATEANGGDDAWVALCPRAWLAGHLAALDAAQLFVDRIAPLSWPDKQPRGHFRRLADEDRVELQWADAEGVAQLSLAGSFSRHRFSSELIQDANWGATAEAVQAAESWLGTPVPVLSDAQRALQALESGWNLRQFELAPRTRGLRAVRQVYRDLMQKSWAPVRWGLAGLLLVQVLGLNIWAWQQNRQLAQLRSSIEGVLRSTHPQVRAVLDAPLQMQRETEALRVQAGRAGEQDLESLLSAAATAWPTDRGPLDALNFETGKLSLSAQGWSEAQLGSFRRQLQSEGWQLELGDGRMTLRRAKPNERKQP